MGKYLQLFTNMVIQLKKNIYIMASLLFFSPLAGPITSKIGSRVYYYGFVQRFDLT